MGSPGMREIRGWQLLGGFSYAQVLNPRKGEIRGHQLSGLGLRGFAPTIKMLF